MRTIILKPEKSTYEFCASLISDGSLVAFPTETVYGLGANAYSDEAVKNIFAVKNRPCDNPLIVHLAGKDDIMLAAREITPTAEKLIKEFMPGPLTVVVKKNPKISPFATGELNTAGVRIPSNPVAREFIKACGVPVAAPSANASTRPSPTEARHVYDDLNGKIPAIIDGGKCEIGIEFTVVDVTGDIPVILRPGKVSAEDIRRVCGDVMTGGGEEKPKSPGVKYRHYSPGCPCKLLRYGDIEYIRETAQKYAAQGNKVTVICYDDTAARLMGINTVSLGKDNYSAAANLFGALRRAEKEADIIFLEKPREQHLQEALLNRMLKACGGDKA